MSDTETATSPAKATTKAKAPKKKVAKPVASHPTYNAMIVAAITALNDRKGSSRQAIAKYVVANYKVDAKAASSRLRVTFRRALEKGELVQVKGSFKLKGDEKKPKVAKNPAAKPSPKKKAAAAPKKAAKKSAPKKAVAQKPKAVAVAKKSVPAKKPAKKTPVKKPIVKKTAKKPAAKKAAAKK